MTRIILASQSPRRRALLHELGLEFETFTPNVNESIHEHEAPDELCLRFSRLKAQSCADTFPDSVIIAADTIVLIDGMILGKPKDHDDAFRMLRLLSGREHEVLTGLTVCRNEDIISHTEHTRVKFRSLSDDEINAYIMTDEPDDKAGGYAVQGRGALLIEGINGDYYNVVGLPLCSLGKILRSFGVNLL